MRTPLVFVFALALAPILGCSEEPARGFERFYEALGSPAALERLTVASRSKLAPDARAALIATPPRLTLREVRVVEQSPDTAILEVEDSLGATEKVTMVREDGVWRVQL